MELFMRNYFSHSHSIMIRPATLLIFACLPLHLGAADFNRDIRPILSDKCFACHGFDEETREADLRLDTEEGAFMDLGGYKAIEPGKPDDSEAWLRIVTDDEDDIMPPKKFHKELTAEEKKLIKEWISEGAEYQIHWAYQPLEKPDGKNIDSFIEAKLKAKGLTLSPEADRATLARRLHLDLLGIPPTPKEVQAFVSDKSPKAYENLIDRLLAKPAYGERMAVYWLDLVRYADTIGYHSDNMMEISAYRDYVINAFNKNLSYEQFTIDQLAGDLLPNPTLDQKIASGYNRLLQTTEEGGAQAAEYMVIYAADRVRNVSNVWLGSTMGCAQCHDHKYDPFSMRDFYSMAAFFADVKERPNGKRQPNLKLPTAEEEKKIAELKKNLSEKTAAKRVASDPVFAKNLAAEQSKWESEMREKITNNSSEWTVKDPAKLVSSGRQTLKKEEDLSVLASGKNPAKDNYTITLKGKGIVRAIRLETLTHDSLVNKSLSRANGNFVLTRVIIKQAGKEIPIASAKADFEQSTWPIKNTLDGNNKTGWAVDGHNKAEDHVAMFLLKQAMDLGDGGEFTVELQHQSIHAKHNIGRFRLSVTESETPTLSGGVNLPPKLIETLKLTASELNAAQKKQLADHYLGIAPLLADTRKQLESWKKELESVEKNIQTTLVSESLPTPRMTRILDRGNWLDKEGEVVQPALPAFLPADKEDVIPEGERATRLDLAHWIMGESNPLTSRTFVNRMWKLFYGEGISRDLGDLGGQGKPPTHPDLLKWLSVDFRENNWDIKRLVKNILMSKTYRQVSTVNPALANADPSNLLWGRQGRWRIEAEFIRDSALSMGGLLINEQGGKSVKPYQPAGYWQHLNFPKRKWEAGKGDELYRRGLYTFWCRSFPHPAMVAFDAPSREECTAERPRSNIPQQALVLLNDPVFVEASRAFGERIAKEGGDSLDAKLSWAWQSATSRQPNPEELTILKTLYQNQISRYSADEAGAKIFLGVDEAETGSKTPLSEQAALSSVARAIINAYEASSRF